MLLRGREEPAQPESYAAILQCIAANHIAEILWCTLSNPNNSENEMTLPLHAPYFLNTNSNQSPKSFKRRKLQPCLTYQSKTVSLTDSHMEGNCRKYKKQVKQHKTKNPLMISITFLGFLLCRIQLFIMRTCYLDLEVQYLVPLRVCIFLNYLSTQLERKKNYTLVLLLLDNNIISSLTKIYIHIEK